MILPNPNPRTGIGLQKLTGDKPLVSQSYPLRRLSANLSLTTLKLLNMYLAAINPMNPNNTAIKFTVHEYAKALGLDYRGVNLAQLRVHLGDLLKLQFSESDAKNRLTLINAFSSAKVEPDMIGGKEVQTITIQANQDARQLFFELKKYLKYPLKNITPLKRVASYWLYLYLGENSYRNTWEDSIGNVREALHWENVHGDVRNFIRYLNESVAECNEWTDLFCLIERINDPNDKRKISGLRFIVAPKQKKEFEEIQKQPELPGRADGSQEQLRLDAVFEEQQRESAADEMKEMLHQAFHFCRYETTYDEQEALIQEARITTGKTGTDLYDYIALVVKKANTRRTPPKNPYKYLYGIIRYDSSNA